MATAGYCSSCHAEVWVQTDGSCPHGHPASDISALREVGAHGAGHSGVQGTGTPMPRPLKIALIVVAILIVLGSCGYVASAAMSMAPQGIAASQEWKTRLADDYPGWKLAGAEVNTIAGSRGTQTNYVFKLTPPGRTFPLGITYTSEDGGRPYARDEILRAGSVYADRATPLLDFIEGTYVAQGDDIVSITSDSEGTATVTWQRVTRVTFFSTRLGAYDILTFDEPSRTWSARSGSQQ